MPRHPVVQKTIHGQEVSQTVFLRTVAEAISECEGGATAGDLTSMLGEEWSQPQMRQLLASTLINMAGRGTIRRVEGHKGLYVTTNHFRRAGVNQFDTDEQAILTAIRRRGGFCRLKDIMEDFDVRPAGGPEGQADIKGITEYQRVLRVIMKSDLIRQDIVDPAIGAGIYNVPWSEVAALPLVGRYVVPYIHHTMKEIKLAVGARVTSREWWDERDAFFSQVGDAFKRLRKMRGLEAQDVVDLKPVRAAVAEFQRKAGPPINEIRHEWMDRMSDTIEAMRTASEISEEGTASERKRKVDHEIAAYRDEQEQLRDTKLGVLLYKRFEKGNPGAHYFAPLILYQAVAEAFEVCPAALSRGVIALLPHTERLRPTRDRRSMDEIIDAELRTEAAIEATRQLLYGSMHDAEDGEEADDPEQSGGASETD